MHAPPPTKAPATTAMLCRDTSATTITKAVLFCLATAAGGLCSRVWAAPVPEQVVLSSPHFRFSLTPETGGFEIRDLGAGVIWQSNPFHGRFGEVSFSTAGKPQRADLARCETRPTAEGLELTFLPRPETPEAWLRVQISVGLDQRSLGFSYAAAEELGVEWIRLLDDALWVTDTEKGYLAVPAREGLLIPADSGRQFTHRFETFAYEGCHMEMLGVVKNGAAALLTWHDPYVAAEVRSVHTNAVWAHGQQVLSPSLVLRKSAQSFRLQFLGKGDYMSVAKAYRQVAKDKGWRVTWDEKLKGHPERAKLFGAINYKLWSTLDRQMNETSTQEEHVRINWTFEESAQVAEHLKNDLKLEKVLFIMGGWIHRGYDNQHPDILPTAPECGGDTAFVDCARRVRQLGYLFCLHDNYQDIYRDSPSWDENLIMKNRDGSLAKGGHWAGGRAYLTCSKKAVELAKRPQNLPAVKKLCGADAYFIDTTYAAGLQECSDQNHPLTRWDDLRWKQVLSDGARDLFGIFGSECGREWAIPHSDFFEGLTGVSGNFYHDNGLIGKVGGTVIPLFEVVYRDCIALYGKYGYDIAGSADYVLHHISIGRPLNYHEVPPHLYWKDSSRTNELPRLGGTAGDRALFTRGQHGWSEGMHAFDRFVKNTAEILSPLNELTAQWPVKACEFLTPDRKVQRTLFGNAANEVETIVNASQVEFHLTRHGVEIVLPPYGFLIDSPRFVAFAAVEYNGVKYESPTLFTLRSLDEKPLKSSSRVRVFHGFGSPQVQLAAKLHNVEREEIIAP